MRPCEDTFAGVDNVVHACDGIGDLPFAAVDSNGIAHRIVLRNVRCVSSFEDTLLSVDQLWEDSRVKVIFQGVNRLELPPDESGSILSFDMRRRDGLFELDSVCTARERVNPARTRALLASAGIRTAHARSHIERLSADEAAAVVHRRLHVGVERLRSLPDFTRDAPDNLRRCRHAPCAACVEANATHLSHTADQYVPSYPGRLIHADIVGPLVTSRVGHFRYMLVLVDDHSRFKFVQFLRSKSDAPAAVANFSAALTGLLGKRSNGNPQVVTTFHSDNAGEFFSRDFSEFLDGENVAHTSCPPHVHQLNGVAERAIRSIMEGVRASIVASGSPRSFWNYAAQHTCDILNRTTGPPTGGVSSYEALLGEKPSVMGIMPFGCRAFAVKPPSAIRKTNIEPHAWVGFNLGRSPDMPGAFHVWLGHLQKVVSTSDVYFDETLMPWLPPESQRVDAPIPVAAPVDEAPQLPSTDPAPMPAAKPKSLSAAAALIDGQRLRRSVACSSRTVLVLFSGPFARPDGLAAFLMRLGLDAQLVDCDAQHGGGDEHDLLRDNVFSQLLYNAHKGMYRAVIAAPPCSTFSISRFFTPADGRQGPPPVRDRNHIGGLPDVPKKHRRELREANELVTRTLAICLAAFDAGGEFILENPADRGDSTSSIFMDEQHGPLWCVPAVIALAKVTSAESITFPQCALGAQYQKYTTLLCTPAFAAQLRSLSKLRCDHASHSQVGGRRNGNEWSSTRSAAYPSDLNLLLAQCCATLTAALEAPAVAEEHAPPAERPTAEPTAPRAAVAPQVAVNHAEAAANDASDARLEAATPTPARPVVAMASQPDGDVSHLPQVTDGHLLAGSARVPTAPPPATESPERSPKRVTWQRAGEPLRGALRSSHRPVLTVRQRNTFNIPPSFWRGDHRCMLAGKAPSTGDPQNRKAMLKTPDAHGWKLAEQAELDNHRSNHSWTEIDRSELPPGRKLVRMTWVYKRKRSGKLKARLCVQGCSQIPGVDFNQTFCATMRGTTLRLLSAVAARGGFHLRRWDFVAAYLQGSLEPGEVVYCFGPPGHETTGADGRPRILRIEKPVYGMAQSGRRWQRSIFPWLVSDKIGLTKLDSDNCVFRRHETVTLPNGSSRKETLIVGLYVDDLFIVHSHNDEHSLYAKFIASLQADWEAEDEGEVSDLLNVEFSRSKRGVKLSQGSYVDTLVERFCPDGVPDSFHANHPPAAENLRELVDAAIDESREIPATAEEVKRFQTITGALLYAAMNTRPDISLAVGLLCRAMSKPTPELQAAAVRVVWYLQRHRDVGLTYQHGSKALSGMSDSDWAVRHSTGGFVFNYCQAAVSWSSKKQPSVALSSCEAELMALSEAAKEALYLKDFLEELELDDGKPLSLGCDNQAAGDLAYNPEHHQRTKHIARRHFFVREAVEDLRIVVPFVATADNMADFFTKPLDSAAFFRLRNVIMNVPVGPSA